MSTIKNENHSDKRRGLRAFVLGNIVVDLKFNHQKSFVSLFFFSLVFEAYNQTQEVDDMSI